MKLLYHLPVSFGGLADYAHEQANALADLGVEVHLLCPPEFPTGRGERYRPVKILRDMRPPKPIPSRALKAVHYTRTMTDNFRTFAQQIVSGNFKHVLMGSYMEYLSPLWAYRLRKLARNGVVFGAVVHEPVRDFVFGPLWWHRHSIAAGYSFLREAFVHEVIELDTVKQFPGLRTTVIPYGTHQFPPAQVDRATTRAEHGIPQDSPMLLAFGHIRDNKNLDLAIRAMADHPRVQLVIAGKGQAASQKPIEFYQRLAEEVGVADRCRWVVEYISEENAANLFEAADAALLTYSRTFRSASGVLSVAANYRKFCLASAGAGSMASLVTKYNLGVWVEPDDLKSLSAGMGQWLSSPPVPDWDRYFAENSWNLNARIILNRLFGASLPD